MGALDRPLMTLDRSPEVLDPLLEALDRGGPNFKNDAKMKNKLELEILIVLLPLVLPSLSQ